MAMKVGSVASNTTTFTANSTRSSTYVVSEKETLTSIAKKFNMTYKEFMAWTGLTSEKIKLGQQIKLPTDKALPGKGLYDIARRNNMTLGEFCKLNNISENYVPQPNEVFYVYNKKNAPAPKTTPSVTPKGSNSTKMIQAYDGLSYPVVNIPREGFLVGDSKNPNVSKSGQSPNVPLNVHGTVCAEVIKFNPQQKGSLSGYTIMVNAGHGFGRKDGKPILKPGAQYKDANGKILSEWYKNRNLADEVIKELTSRGATVIYTTGDAREAIAAKSVGKPNLLISLHCDAAETSKASGLKMMYASGEKDSYNFASALYTEFSNKYNNNCNVITDKDSSHGYIGILHGGNGYDVPAVLCEMGFMSNGTDIKNIDSSNQRKLAADCIGNACEAYLKQ